nr:hypothetical protein [Tanacetum cinerariifolium]
MGGDITKLIHDYFSKLEAGKGDGRCPVTLKLPNSQVFRGLRLNWLPNALVGFINDTVGEGIDAQFWTLNSDEFNSAVMMEEGWNMSGDITELIHDYFSKLEAGKSNGRCPVTLKLPNSQVFRGLRLNWLPNALVGSINDTVGEGIDAQFRNVDKSMDPFEMEKLTKPELSDSEEKE